MTDEKKQEASSQEILHFLTVEYSALQTARAAAIANLNNRVGVFFILVSSGIIALAFLAQSASAGRAFFLFGFVLFASLFFLGFITFLGALQTATENTIYSRGITQICQHYTEIAPRIRNYLMHSMHDDSFGMMPDAIYRKSIFQSLSTTTGAIIVTNSLIAGIWITLGAQFLFQPPLWLTMVFGVFLFVVVLGAHYFYQIRAWEDFEADLTVKYPISH